MNPEGLEKAQKFFEELGCVVTPKEPINEKYPKRCFVTMTSDTFEYLLKHKLEGLNNG